MSSSYLLQVKSVDGIPWKTNGKPPNLYVAIYRDDIELQRTRKIERELAPKWDHLLAISLDPPSSTLSLRLFHHSLLPFVRDKCLATVVTDIAMLMRLCDSDGHAKVANLELTKSNGKPAGTISVSLMRADQAAALAGNKVQKDMENIGLPVPSAIVETGGVVVPSVSIASQMVPALASITSKLAIMVRVGDEITTIHPYASIAWKVLTSVYQAVKNQQETDDKLLKLVETMNNVYSFVVDSDAVTLSKEIKLKGLDDSALAIIQQTVECALFIQEYSANGFWDRTLRNTWIHPDQKIADLIETLLNLKASFHGHSTIQVLFLSTKLLDKVEGLEQSNTLKKLNPVDMNASLRLSCLPGTRREILDKINEWLAVPSDSSNVLWLSGVAGSGKSTISTTVSESFGAVARLGAFLFFDRNDLSRSHPAAVIPTIAYSLALFSPHIGSAISAAIQKDPGVVKSPMGTQFKKLLLEPLQLAERYIQGPIIIILDALDECGDRDSRAPLLSLLSTKFPGIPRLFRFLITSRRDPDIVNKFNSHFVEMELNTGRSSIEDVGLFIHHKLAQIREDHSLGSAWPGDERGQALVHRSGGLFIWASTATRFLNDYDPDDRLKTLLTDDPTHGVNLDGLYTVALQNSGNWMSNRTFALDAHAVLACVVLGRVPMSDTTIDMLLYSGQQRSSGVLKFLGCLIQWSPGKEARTLHASFADYLMDPTRSGGEPWFIDPNTEHHSLSVGCLRILEQELQFNVCELEDSHFRNADVVDMSKRVADKISPQLSYASRFFFDHIRETPVDKAIMEGIESFLHCKFLYWLEVLSLLGRIPIVAAGLGAAAHYAEDGNEGLKEFITDTIRFIAAFAPVIAQSAPHIYLSALPFAPRRSKIARQFAKSFPGSLHPQSSMGEDWPSIQKILRGHSGPVNSITFSPDGALIASGSRDKTMCVWDAQTGELLVEPIQGHTLPITAVHFSPDGTRIASGSKDQTVRVWDTRTGTLVAGPFEGRTDCVHFSPDGSRIATVDEDNVVCIWNTQTGALVTGAVQGPVDHHSLSFSPDGTRIASRSSHSNETIHIWDAETGALVAGPFKGHTGRVRCVHFSPDGGRLASGSSDNTVCIWDAQNGTLIAGPFEGHTGSVECVCFSPDGTRIASGSYDNTVRVWDAQTGVLVAGPFEGHTHAVFSIRFAPNSTWIATGSFDSTVRVWDTRPNTGVPGKFEGHTDWVTSVPFSPDGMRIASGSVDNTVRVWDIKTGALVAGPFEHNTWVRSVRYLPDGVRVASWSESTIRVWDIQTGILVAGPFNEDAWINSVHHGSDEPWVASRFDGNTDLLQNIGPFEGHNARITCAHLTADGTRIVSGSDDNSVHVWDAQNRTLIAGPFEGHASQVLSVHLSPDGTQIASGSQDNTIRVWNVQTSASGLGPVETPASPDKMINPAPLGDYPRMDDGWVLNSSGHLMFWVPPWLREGLYLPHNTLVICARGTTKIDFSRFVHGTEWQKCINTKFRDTKFDAN
ncbi:hypothetical protein C8R44DRAFT_884965 [Mycena epipterygia]|nr:hypothetical protein C8R44DRAFT_884965 [Mycena epipterygia]